MAMLLFTLSTIFFLVVVTLLFMNEPRDRTISLVCACFAYSVIVFWLKSLMDTGVIT